MKINGIKYLSVRTDKFLEVSKFYSEILGLEKISEEQGYTSFKFANGDILELFDGEYPYHKHFTTVPVPGIEVDDIAKARAELESKGIKFVGPIQGNSSKQWTHFVGEDGNIYELRNKKSWWS